MRIRAKEAAAIAQRAAGQVEQLAEGIVSEPPAKNPRRNPIVATVELSGAQHIGLSVPYWSINHLVGKLSFDKSTCLMALVELGSAASGHLATWTFAWPFNSLAAPRTCCWYTESPMISTFGKTGLFCWAHMGPQAITNNIENKLRTRAVIRPSTID